MNCSQKHSFIYFFFLSVSFCLSYSHDQFLNIFHHSVCILFKWIFRGVFPGYLQSEREKKKIIHKDWNRFYFLMLMMMMEFLSNTLLELLFCAIHHVDDSFKEPGLYYFITNYSWTKTFGEEEKKTQQKIKLLALKIFLCEHEHIFE